MEVLSVKPKVNLTSDKMLANIYTPGVGKSSLKIKDNIDRVFDLTNRSNSIGVISYDFMKSYKRAIFLKKKYGVDAYPLEIEKTTRDDLDFVIENIMPNFMGVDSILIENENKIEAECEIPTQSKSCLYSGDLEELEPVRLRELFGGVVELEIEEKDKLIKPIGIVSDGSAVLGLGNIGAEAGLPVMEGKAVLFKELGDVDAYSLCLGTQKSEEIIKIVKLLQNSFSGVNLEDISAPRCFEIERRLIDEAKIPIFHDDQHGTAIVVLSGLLNAIEVVKKKIDEVKIVISGAGAAGLSICKLLLKAGFLDITICDTGGIVYQGREKNNPELEKISKYTNKRNLRGALADALVGADIFIGVSAPNILTPEMIKTMAENSIIFALANPIPEITPDLALKSGARIAASGRSDFENQINNCLAFPGLFNGVINSGCKKITEDIQVECALSISGIIGDEELSENYIIPKALDRRVAKNISACIMNYVRELNVEHTN